MATRWNRDEAMADAQAMVKEAAGWKVEEQPARTRAGHQWCCNGCPFKTPHLSVARDHLAATPNGGAFPHMLWERPAGELGYAATRRMHLNPYGQSVVTVVPKKRAAAKKKAA